MNNERLFLFKQVIRIKSKITDLQVIKLKTCGTRILVEGEKMGQGLNTMRNVDIYGTFFFFSDKTVTRSRGVLETKRIKR